MTTIPQQRSTRQREPICPPWCQGHGGEFLPWDTLADGKEVRLHAGVDATVESPTPKSARIAHPGSVGVELVLEEHEDHTLTPAMVEVYLGNDSADLTPEAARALAAVLLMAATDAEATR